MNSHIAFAAASFLALTAGSASAQTAIVTETETPVITQKNSPGGEIAGATTGAVAGAVVGGPVGAAVGGVVGLAVGAVAEPAETELSYVHTNRVDPIVMDGDVALGTQLPDTVVLQEIPQSKYRYVYVNERPVFVDPDTRQVVYIEK
jgi:hypothetical protein